MTIPSVLAMYGIVLGYISENSKDADFDVWSEKIVLTPILFTAFWNLAGMLENKVEKTNFTSNKFVKRPMLNLVNLCSLMTLNHP